MSVSSKDYLNQIFKNSVALGKRAVNSDAYFEIEGHEDVSMLIQQFPWPKISPGDAIEIPLPMGVNSAQPSQVQVYQQGAVTISETEAGHAQNLMESLIANGGTFNAKIYEGTPTNYSRVCKIYGAFFSLEPTDRGFENRAQLLTYSGTLHYHYFGSQ